MAAVVLAAGRQTATALAVSDIFQRQVAGSGPEETDGLEHVEHDQYQRPTAIRRLPDIGETPGALILHAAGFDAIENLAGFVESINATAGTDRHCTKNAKENAELRMRLGTKAVGQWAQRTRAKEQLEESRRGEGGLIGKAEHALAAGGEDAVANQAGAEPMLIVGET